jgi:Na+:H+ antiporter, NhaA family
MGGAKFTEPGGSVLLTGIRRFIESESAGGVVLAVTALLALAVSNSPWSGVYEAFVHIPGELRIGGDWLVLSKPLLVWINDLWMAVFFFLVGLEIKREVLEGELADLRQALLPAGAALGAINWGNPVALRGWAIPTATDIAFALGVLMLLGKRVPSSLKVFLAAVAIIDDLGAIIVIAIFYTEQLSLTMLVAASVGAAVLWVLNRSRVISIGPYVVVGLLIWVCVLKSGVHATLAGVIAALAIPMSDGKGGSPLRTAEHALHPWVAFAVLPLFAFVNAGVSLGGASVQTFLSPVPAGIALGLLLGKAVGVFGASWLLMRFGGASLPQGATGLQFFAVCVLCGIGFTMSLFIGGLAFEGLGAELGGSLLSAMVGAGLLLGAPRKASDQ